MRLLASLFVALIAMNSEAQDPTPGVQLPTDGRGPAALKFHKFVGMPLIVSTPTFGIGPGAVIAYVPKRDTADVPLQAVGVGGFFASSSNWVVGAGGIARFSDDTWRLLTGIEWYNLRYDFFGIGNAAGNRNLSQRVKHDGTEAMLGVDALVAPHWWVGPRARYLNLRVTLAAGDTLNVLTPIVRRDDDFTAAFGGGATTYDSRNIESYPSHGTFARGKALFARGWMGSDRNFENFEVWGNQYVTLNSRQVLAARLYGCGASGNVPAWELCEFGTGSDLRGYIQGRWRDRTMLAGQVEWRYGWWKRFGAVAFAGVGEVASSLASMSGDNMLPSVGLGARYLAFRKSKLNVGVDYAWAKKGGATYLRVGEAF